MTNLNQKLFYVNTSLSTILCLVLERWGTFSTHETEIIQPERNVGKSHS